MHDPMSVAHEIHLGKKRKKNGNYKTPLVTIWHVDPEKDGTDDSCGWFIRSRHLPKELIEKVRREFEFEFKNNYWFNEAGYPVFSTIGTAIEMYSKTAWIYFMWKDGNNPTNKARRRYRAFMRKHLFDIIHFAENPTDSLHSYINMKYGVEKKEERISQFVSIILPDIVRKCTPWYKHPRWHVHHWKIQFPVWRAFRRRYFDKCCKCGKRGFKSSPFSDWDGSRLWHQECDDSTKTPVK